MQLLGGSMDIFPNYLSGTFFGSPRIILLRLLLGQEAQSIGFEAEPTALCFLSVVPAASSFY